MAVPAWAAPESIRVAVLDDAPPLSYRDPGGQLAGFSIEIMRLLCAEAAIQCEFEVHGLERLVDDLSTGHLDVAAIGLLATPERQRKILFTRPVFRSLTLFFAHDGVQPGQRGERLSVFKGSAQEDYARRQGWDYVGAISEEQIVRQLEAGVVHACMVPLMTSINLQRNPRFASFGLIGRTLPAGELTGEASFGVNPARPELKAALDLALERIKMNGAYDRINTKYLPLRVN
jgi:ABC-type amino acid transport substrate-binding protein